MVRSRVGMPTDVRSDLLQNMVAGKHELLFGQKEANVPGGVTWCDKRLEPPPFGHHHMPLIDTKIDVKRRTEAFEVWEDIPMLACLLRWQAMMEKLLLALIVQASLDPLPDRTLGIPHDNLRTPQVANTSGLATVVIMEMRDDHLCNRLEIQAKIVRLTLQAGKGLGGINPGIDQQKTIISFHEIDMDVVQSEWKGMVN